MLYSLIEEICQRIIIGENTSFQKSIIANTRSLNKEVFVATNLLESMISNPSPTRAELNDIYNTLLDGATGLVLAAETAIGKFLLSQQKLLVI